MFFWAVLEASPLPRPSVSPLSLKMTNTNYPARPGGDTGGFLEQDRGAAVDRDRGGASGGGTSHRLDIIRSRRSSACGPADKQILHRPWMQSGGRRGQTGWLRGGCRGEQAHQSQVTSDTAGESLTVAASSLQTLGHLWGRLWGR